MTHKITDSRVAWLLLGIVAGYAITATWLEPNRAVQAASTDRDDKFAVVTSTTQAGTSEAIFALDFLTGQLTGGILDARTGKFQTRYSRNIAQDFNVDPKAEPHYAIVPGHASLNAAGGLTLAQGVIYIGELTSGKVLGYSYPIRNPRPGQLQQSTLQPLDGFQFREAFVGN